MDYKVTQVGSIITKKGRHAQPGEKITSEELGDAEKEMLRDGKIVAVNVPLPPPQTSIQQSSIVLGQDGLPKAIPGIKKEMTPAPVAPVIPAPTLTSPWEFNPRDLTGKNLEELNSMIIERSPTTQPFDDKAEAVAYLSQDFKE